MEVELLKKYGVKRCVYGHLHGNSLRYAVTGEAEGIEWKLVSGDFVDFTPVSEKIEKTMEIMRKI